MFRDETDKEGELVALDYDTDTSKGERAVKVAVHSILKQHSASFLKVILLGDSAVGKSKLVERFLLDGYAPQQLSTYALTLYRWDIKREIMISKLSNGRNKVPHKSGNEGRSDRFLGHCGARKVQHHAQELLPPGACLHHGFRCNS